MSKLKKFNINTMFVIILLLSVPFTLAEELTLNYDAVGNLVSGDGFQREYDGFNHLVRIKNATGAVLEEFEWHPTEERVFIKKTYKSDGSLNQRITYLNDNTIKIKNSSGTYYENNVYQEGMLVAQIDTDGNKFAVHDDHLGSVSLLTDGAGNVAESSFYSPYGESLDDLDFSRFGFTGKEQDGATGEIDFNARMYKPEWGKFSQPDPIKTNLRFKTIALQSVLNPQNLNSYSYVSNNPYNYIDKNGLWAISVYGGAGAGAGPYSGSASIHFAISYSDEYGVEVGTFSTESFGYSIGVEAERSFGGTFSPNANRISDLFGESTTKGFSAAYGHGLSFDKSVSNDNKKIINYNLAYSPGISFAVHQYTSDTSGSIFFNFVLPSASQKSEQATSSSSGGGGGGRRVTATIYHDKSGQVTGGSFGTIKMSSGFAKLFKKYVGSSNKKSSTKK